MKVLGVTISRQGSKRIPGKNMKMICGRPLLEWTLLQLTGSKHIVDYWLTTDSEEQAKLAQKHNFKIAWQETKEIDEAEAEGQLGGSYAMRRGIEAAQKDAKDQGEGPFNVVVPLLPTSCLRKPDDIDRCIEFWLEHQELPALGTHHYKYQLLYELKEGVMVPSVFDNQGRYWDGNGVISVANPEQYMRFIFKPDGKANTIQEQMKVVRYWPFPLERWQLFDLDEPDDWEIPEYFLEHKILKGDPDVYQKYKERMLSEFGFEQHASKYNQGVEQNLLPAEYRNSFFNHLPVYLETMKVPESIVGWELNELKKDDTGTISRHRMKLIKARNGTDVFAEENVLKEPQPALIIASGKSLDDAMPLIKDWKGATFCSTSHASTLIHFGHEPSHMIAYDINTRPQEQDWVDTWEGRKTVMVTHPGMYPGTLESWPLRKMYFKSMDTSNFFFTSVLPVAYGDVIPSHMFLFSCSVSAQMSIAHALGYSPLFFVGCDFAYGRFTRWRYDHEKGEWISDPEVQRFLGNLLTSENGIKTDALQSFYKRSVICVWRIDKSKCLNVSNRSIITEMPHVDIKDVIANQGRGFEKYTLSEKDTEDVAEKYLAHFNQFVLQFTPDENGRVSYRVLESHAGDNWREDLVRYLAQIKQDMKAQRMKLDIDINANMQRFISLKEMIAEEEKVAAVSN